MSEKSEQTIAKLKIVGEMATDSGVKQIAKIIANYIEEDKKEEVGFKNNDK